jgi:hypothetical protein
MIRHYPYRSLLSDPSCEVGIVKPEQQDVGQNKSPSNKGHQIRGKPSWGQMLLRSVSNDSKKNSQLTSTMKFQKGFITCFEMGDVSTPWYCKLGKQGELQAKPRIFRSPPDHYDSDTCHYRAPRVCVCGTPFSHYCLINQAAQLGPLCTFVLAPIQRFVKSLLGLTGMYNE